VTVQYQFPTPDEQPNWEYAVNTAINLESLRWVRVVDHQWILTGDCPRCHHHFSQYVDLEVVVSDSLSAKTYTAQGQRTTLEVVCLCDEDPPHRKDTKGCGAGRGLQISVVTPGTVTDAASTTPPGP
jgi:hypothetical protein